MKKPTPIKPDPMKSFMVDVIKEVTENFIKAFNKPKVKPIGKLITIDFKKGIRVQTNET